MYTVTPDCQVLHEGSLQATPSANRRSAFAEARDRFGCRTVTHRYEAGGTSVAARTTGGRPMLVATTRRPQIASVRTTPTRAQAATVTSASLIGDILGGIGDAILPGSGTIIRGVDRAITGGGDGGRSGPALPQLPGTGPSATEIVVGCTPPLVRDQGGGCVFPGSPGDISTAGPAVPGTLPRPRAEQRRTLVCPTFADGRKGILWFSPMSNEIFCLPRGVNGKAWGLIRKNKPRKKAYISAAEKKQLDRVAAIQKKAKEFASAAGFTTTKKGTKRKK